MAPPGMNDNIQWDLENGNVDKEKAENHPNPGELDEYGQLVKYISTYRDGRRKSTASALGLEDDGKKKPWWKFWGKKAKKDDTDFETPDDWIETDIKAGLRSADVEARRKKTGWNELTTEKENMFLKFLSYFTGPILYGKQGNCDVRKLLC